MIALYLPAAAFHYVMPSWIYAIGLLGMLVGLSSAFPELRTVRARRVLSAVVLAVSLSVGSFAFYYADPCSNAAFAADHWIYCWFAS